MCGIAGIISTKGEVDPITLREIEKAMVHRGPDDSGIFLSKDKRVGLDKMALLFLLPCG